MLLRHRSRYSNCTYSAVTYSAVKAAAAAAAAFRSVENFRCLSRIRKITRIDLRPNRASSYSSGLSNLS